MTNEEKEQIIDEALSTFDIETQVIVLYEEMAELQKALCKLQRYYGMGVLDRSLLDDVREEIADVQIMLDQMKMFFDTTDTRSMSITDWIDFKLERLKGRIADAKK